MKHGGNRVFADQFDRHYELYSYNVHPNQLFTYQLANERLLKETEDRHTRERGEQTLEDQFITRVEEAVAEEKQRSGSDRISFEKAREILDNLNRQMRQETMRPHTRDENGDFNDFLEVRRPFISPSPGVSH